MKSRKDSKKTKSLFSITLTIFLGLLASLLMYYVLSIVADLVSFVEFSSPIVLLSILLGISAMFGALVSVFVARRISKPLDDMSHAISEITKGNFDVKIERAKTKMINDVIDNINKMAEELKSIETLKTDFISSVSHQFKTPISVIQSYIKALKSEDLDADTRARYQEIVDINLFKLNGLVSNILGLSKIENQKIDATKTEFSLDEQIKCAIIALEPEWAKKNIELDIDLIECDYYGEEKLIEQIWHNLIDNAIKYSKKDGKIEISLKTAGEKHQVIIKDYGIGMDEKTVMHAFDKFYQGDNGMKEGTGLGLSIVDSIAKIIGAQIELESKQGVGTTFKVTL